MSDLVETIGASTVQHGPYNDRVYLMHLAAEEGPAIVDQLEQIAERDQRSKVFAKVPPARAPWFTARGYQIEATIPPGPGSEGLVFVSRFVDATRAEPRDEGAAERVLERVRADGDPRTVPPLPDDLRECAGEARDAEAIAQLYGVVFQSYPFPIDEPAFVRKSMANGVTYFTIRTTEGAIVAVSAAEPAEGGTMLEMTDFATEPRCRGLGLARRLLAAMDRAAERRGIALAFTIARSPSVGMNLTFRRGGYRYAGTLVNNTNISGGLESMNVWYRYLGVTRR